MLARTPLSTCAKSFTPKVETWSSCQLSDLPQGTAQPIAWVPVFLASTLQPMDFEYSGLRLPEYLASIPDCAQNAESKPQSMGYMWAIQNAEYDLQEMSCGRTCTNKNVHRLPSRTPSPSCRSRCLSEVSAAAESLLTQEAPITGTSTPDLNECSEDSNAFQDFVVKNTFYHCDVIENTKLSRSSSAPDILLSGAFMTMLEMHEQGKCSPCAYFYGKTDGCRQGSSCTYCHLCPPGEVKKRSLIKRKSIKARRAALKALQADSDQSILGEDVAVVQ